MSCFYMVMNVTTNAAPKCKHWNYSDAADEAQRLAKANPEQKFVVLIALESFICEISAPIREKIISPISEGYYDVK